MAGYIENKTVSSLIGKYFDRLAVTGYVGKNITCKLMIYLFLVSFVNAIYDFMSVEDYCKVDKVLSKLFNGQNCLLPYDPHMSIGSSFTGVSVMDVTIGAPRWMGNGSYSRVIEDRSKETDRITETDYSRTI